MASHKYKRSIVSITTQHQPAFTPIWLPWSFLPQPESPLLRHASHTLVRPEQKMISLVRRFISDGVTCLHDKNQEEQTGDDRVSSTEQPKILVKGKLGICLGRVYHSPQSGDSDGQIERNGKHERGCVKPVSQNCDRTYVSFKLSPYRGKTHRTKSRSRPTCEVFPINRRCRFPSLSEGKSSGRFHFSDATTMDKGESYLNGGRGLVKEGVKVCGILRGFGRDFDV